MRRRNGVNRGAIFEAGAVIATQEAMVQLEASGVFFMQLVARHVKGEWGDASPHLRAENDRAVLSGGVVRSIYSIEDYSIMVRTERDRSVTTLTLL